MRCPTTRWGRALRRLLKSEQGAVYTEAVITLPFFIMIWAFLIFTHSTVHEKIKNNAIAKGCTWSYALNYCERASLPASCGSTSFSDAPPAEWTDSDVADFMRRVPFIGDIILGKGSYGSRTATARKPGYLGGGDSSVQSRHSVSCNEKPKTVGDLIDNIFGMVTGSVPLR
jgi:hypothetical protein